MNQVITGLAGLLVVAALAAGPARAQQHEGEQAPREQGENEAALSPEEPGAEAGQVSRIELQKYQEIHRDIVTITHEIEQQMKDQKLTPEERASLQRKYVRRVEQALDERNMTTGRYNRIRSRVLADPSLLDGRRQDDGGTG